MCDDYSESTSTLDTSSDTSSDTSIDIGSDFTSELPDDTGDLSNDGSDELVDDVNEDTLENEGLEENAESTCEENLMDEEIGKTTTNSENDLDSNVDENLDKCFTDEKKIYDKDFDDLTPKILQKNYSDDEIGRAECLKDEAFNALNDFRKENNLGKNMYPSAEEQKLIDRYKDASDAYDKLIHDKELKDAKFFDATIDFSPTRWNDMQQDEREMAIDRLSNYCCEDLGINNKPTITYYDGDKGDYGWSSDGEIGINVNEMNDAIETADTIAHEHRHQYQQERAENPQTPEEYEWRENLKPGNYIRPEIDRRGYWNQPVERDARQYAQRYRDQIGGLN